MGYSKEIYRQALSEKERMCKECERTAELSRRTAYAKLPRLAEIDRQLGEAGARLALAALGGGNLETLQAECRKLTDEKDALLAPLGLTSASFTPAYACAACKDTGRDGAKLCACVHRLAKKLAYEQLSSSLPLEESRFDNFDPGFYPDAAPAGQASARKRMTALFAFCKQYAESFSERADSLLFFGNTGLGKTHLSLAIARSALEKGFGVIYASTQDLISAVEREHFGRADGSALENALSCDLLILDDMGTDRPTIVSTNLTIRELEERYTPRVTSRIIGNYVMKEFVGQDIRQQKRLRQIQMQRDR